MARSASLLMIAALAGLALSAQAHHSWSSIYNTDETITVSGVVTEFKFQSPHLALMMDVQTPTGAVEEWTVEWGSPRRAAESGYDKNVLQPGDAITVMGNPAWTPGRTSVRMRELTRPADGFVLSGRREGGRGR